MPSRKPEALIQKYKNSFFEKLLFFSHQITPTMKAFILLFVLSACTVFNHAVESEITYLRKDNISYFIHSADQEAVFIQHDKDQYKLPSTENLQVSYDFSQHKVTVLYADGKEVIFTTDPEQAARSQSAFLVLGLGHTYYNEEAVQDDGTIALDCGCFAQGTSPTVNGQPADCANNNPQFATGCGVSNSMNLDMAILDKDKRSSAVSGCRVVCGGGAYACCLNEGTFDSH